MNGIPVPLGNKPVAWPILYINHTVPYALWNERAPELQELQYTVIAPASVSDPDQIQFQTGQNGPKTREKNKECQVSIALCRAGDFWKLKVLFMDPKQIQ
jgi:hypothetical protein